MVVVGRQVKVKVCVVFNICGWEVGSEWDGGSHWILTGRGNAIFALLHFSLSLSRNVAFHRFLNNLLIIQISAGERFQVLNSKWKALNHFCQNIEKSYKTALKRPQVSIRRQHEQVFISNSGLDLLKDIWWSKCKYLFLRRSSFYS